MKKKPSKSHPAPRDLAVTRLRSRLARTQKQLDEARQTLEAIGSGAVDALVVSAADGERVFTLTGADHRYRQIVERMREGAAIVNDRGTVLYANVALARLVGEAPEAFLGTSLQDYMTADAAPVFTRLLADAKHRAFSVKLSLSTRAGALVPVHVSGTAELEREHDGICLVVTDLTEAMKASQRQHADEFRQLIDNLPLLAWHARPDGHIEFFNASFYAYTGTSLTEMEGWGWASVLRSDTRAAVVERWRQCTETGEPFELEFPIRGADGVYRWFLTRAQGLRDENHRIVRWFGTNTNIDEQKREATARELLAKMNAALSASLTMDEIVPRVTDVLVPEIADICTLYLRTSSGAVALSAMKAKEGLHESVLRVVEASEAHEPDASIGYARVLRSGKIELTERVTDAEVDGVSRSPSQQGLLRGLGIVSWAGIPLERHGQTIGALCIASTTEERRYTADDLPLFAEIGEHASIALENVRLYQEAQAVAEAERLARSKVEESTRLKDEFLATMSHELRTPLNAILGWGRILQSGALEPDKRAHALDVVVRNAVAQNQLIDDLLDVSRIVSGKMRLDVALVDLSNVVAAAVDVVQPAADAKGVKIATTLDPSIGFVSGDAGRLQQIAWNLLTNAVKFTPRGGRVGVTLQREESSVVITVADSGDGIAPQFLPYVFDRFSQGDGSITRKSGGLGLGLAIVRHLIELHGGSVSVSSDGLGKGATFVVKLPIAPVRSMHPATSGQANGHSSAPEVAGLKVLVVDDEADARELLRLVIEACSGVVLTASSVPEALAIVRSNPPDVVVCDIGMPVEDGYSFVRKLRALPFDQGGRIPAVALTAYARAEDRTRALRDGFQNHASKPVDTNELLAVLASLTGRYNAGAPS